MSQTLYHEIRQTRPFRSLEEEVYIAIRLTAQTMDEPWVRYLRTAERISPSQYNLLRILRGAGVEGRTMGEIAERMINRDPDVTRLADGMVKRGLARRARDEQDRRVVKLFSTRAGLDMLSRLDEVVDVYLHSAVGALGKARLTRLRDLLNEVRQKQQPFPPAGAEG